MDKLVNKERHELVSNDDQRMVDFIRIKPTKKYRRKTRTPKPPPPASAATTRNEGDVDGEAVMDRSNEHA